MFGLDLLTGALDAVLNLVVALSGRISGGIGIS